MIILFHVVLIVDPTLLAKFLLISVILSFITFDEPRAQTAFTPGAFFDEKLTSPAVVTQVTIVLIYVPR